MTEEKRGPGRPKKEVEKDFNDLSEPEKILHLYERGYTDAAICRGLEMSKEEFDERYKSDAEFARWISFGRTMCQAWWEDKYRDSAEGAKLNAPMVNFAMKNLFGWAEKSETTNTDISQIGDMSRDEAMQKLRELGPKIADIIEMRPKKAG
jgi:hypothetical protein